MFAAACASANARGNLALDAVVHTLAGAVVSTGCFEALGVRPHLGRLLTPADGSTAGGPAAVVIGHALWRRAFAADAAVVGRTALLKGVSVVIVGVAEPGFAGISLDSGAEFWTAPALAPALLSPQTLTARGDRRFRMYARFAGGVSATQAADRLAGIAAQLRVEDPAAWTQTTGAARTVTVVPERQARFAGTPGAAREIATAILGAIAAIVAIACVNLATMIVARGAARTRELSVRLALGASRRRLLRQLATESLLISIAGSIAGLGLVAAALKAFGAYRPVEVPAFDVTLDWRVAAFAIAMAIAAPVLFGVAPGAHALRLAIAEGLKGRPVTVGRRSLRVGSRDLLIVVQVAVSFALIVMAALFTRALDPAAPGPRPAAPPSVAVVPIELNTATRSDEQRSATIERILQAAARVPHVDAVTAAAIVPMTGSYMGIVGRPDVGPDAPMTFDGNIVAPGYFELTGIPLRAGRHFDARDHRRAPRVAIVSESLAREVWKTPAAVGRTIRRNDGVVEVVGVVADVPYRSLSGEPQPVVYLPLAQAVREGFVLHAHVRQDGEALAALVRELRAVDPRMVVGPAETLAEFLDRANAGARIAQGIGGAAGLLQLGLALMATWGLVAYSVQRRTVEIAIRRALGATESSILRLVMRPGLLLLAVGGALGSLAGVAGAHALHSSFLGLAPIDLTAVVPAAALLAAVVAAAAWLPARRAVATEPAAALKQD
jgi:predicted permease